MRAVCRLVLVLLLLAFAAGSAWPHDASSYGGVFRSRNFGGTWLRADVGLFLNVPLIVAVDPRNPSHLLAGTDLGLIVSHNGGLTWAPEARDLIFGAVFARSFRQRRGRKVRAPRKARCRLTAGGGDPRESATENTPPSPRGPAWDYMGGKGEMVR